MWQITKNEKNDGQVDKLKYVYRVVIRGKGMEDMSKKKWKRNIATFFHKKRKYKSSKQT